MLKLDYKNAVEEHEIKSLDGQILAAAELVHNKTGEGGDFLGWVDLPQNYDRVEYNRIKEAAKKIQANSDVHIVIGIGGSYLGARAAVEMLGHSFYNYLDKSKRKMPQIFFAGNSISSTYMAELIELIDGKDFSINVISKSGTTTEPAIAFRLFRDLLQKKYGNNLKDRIFVTTDKSRGALKKLADDEGYETFVVPDDIGGRYSVLTAVGLLPIAVSGADLDAIMAGAADAMERYKVVGNDCYNYAAARNALYRKGKTTEIMVNYEPRFHFMAEWWKQLFGESEGKDNKGIFPAAVDFSTDLHSMGQYIQQGQRNIFETVVVVDKPIKDVVVINDEENIDGLNFLTGKTMDYINKQAYLGTLLAHTDGQVPNIIITIDKLDEYNFGHLVYFFEKACGVSGYTLGVNPFNQPGVEDYKRNMFALLGKPGFEDKRTQLLERLKK